MNFKSKNPNPVIAEFTDVVWIEIESRLEQYDSWRSLCGTADLYEDDVNTLEGFKSFFDIVSDSEWYDLFEIVERHVDWAEIYEAAKLYFNAS